MISTYGSSVIEKCFREIRLLERFEKEMYNYFEPVQRVNKKK